MQYLWNLAAIAAAYLIGSVSFAVVVSKLMGLPDPHSYGSKNPGATNVLRTGNKGLAAATLFGDMLKGTIAVIVAGHFGGPNAAIAAGIGAFVGHLFPVWLKFKGGKGVATYIGVLLGLFWPGALAFCAIWIAVAVIFRYSSLAALVASLIVPVMLFWSQHTALAAVFALMTAALWIMHRANIQRLMSGTEGKIGKKG